MQELIEEIRYPGKSKLVEAHLTGALDDEELHGGH
jgi:cation/acetate symporter